MKTDVGPVLLRGSVLNYYSRNRRWPFLLSDLMIHDLWKPERQVLYGVLEIFLH